MKMIKKVILTMMSLMVIAIPTAFATETTNFSVTLSTDKQEVEKGSEVTITVDVEEFSDIGTGINAFMAELEYDTTKISIKETQSGTELKKEIIGQNGWEDPEYYNDRIITDKDNMVKSNEDIMTITFIVNENATVGTTAITVKNAEAANEDYDFVGKAGTINLTIKEKTPAQQQCEHTYGNYTDNEDGTHSRECTKCQDKQTENCEYEVDGDKKICSKCGAEVTITEEHEHTYEEFKDNGDGTHTSKCESCQEELKEEHTYKDGKCTKCKSVEPDDKGNEENEGETGNKYPQAGITTTLLLVITIVALISIVLYRKNQIYKGI